MGMGQNLLVSIFMGTSINPSYFDVNRRGTIGFDTRIHMEWKCFWKTTDPGCSPVATHQLLHINPATMHRFFRQATRSLSAFFTKTTPQKESGEAGSFLGGWDMLRCFFPFRNGGTDSGKLT